MSLPIAIVASGNGTNAQAMIDLMKAGVLDVDIRLIFCNRPGAPVLERARKAGVPSRMLDHTKFPDRASFDLPSCPDLAEASMPVRKPWIMASSCPAAPYTSLR